MKTSILFIVFMAFGTLSTAQTINFSAEVTLEYDGQTLDFVLNDLTKRYGIKFSYSRQIIPVDNEITITLDRVPLVTALDDLFAGTAVIYGFIGDQLVLSVDPTKDIGYFPEDDYDNSMAGLGDQIIFAPRTTVPSPTKLQTSRTSFEMNVTPREWASQNADYIQHERDRRLDQAERESGAVRLQASIFPPLSVHTHPDSEFPVNISFNLFWGANNALSGFEMGGFGNYIRGNVDGLQLAGAFNGSAGILKGVQIGGFGNYVEAASTGLQVGGFGNLAKHGGDLVQIGGATNIAGNHIATQIAGAVNVAERVAVQIAPINVAKHVTGLQLGVINVADTVSGTAIGLFTFVKNGYRSLEFAAEESVYANANFRLGVRTFYNIFHIGVNDEHARTWSLGYGIGTSLRAGRRNYIQLELMSRHINEEESWTNDLNLLNSFNVTWDIKIGGIMRLAIGPTFNVAVSQRYNEDTDTYGMDIPNYTIHEKTYSNGGDPVNVKYWIGFHAGLRFSSN